MCEKKVYSRQRNGITFILKISVPCLVGSSSEGKGKKTDDELLVYQSSGL